MLHKVLRKWVEFLSHLPVDASKFALLPDLNMATVTCDPQTASFSAKHALRISGLLLEARCEHSLKDREELSPTHPLFRHQQGRNLWSAFYSLLLFYSPTFTLPRTFLPAFSRDPPPLPSCRTSSMILPS